MIALVAAIVVLMYHRVAPDVPRTAIGLQLTVAPTAFRAQLALLRREHVRVLVLTAEDAARRIAHGERADGVVLTFDDGRVGGYTEVAPALRNAGMTGTFYVNSSTIDGPLHMTWRDLRALRAEGMEIGCHGHEHVDLSQLDAAQQRYEIGHCLDLVAQHVSARPRTYAYASGRYDDETRTLVRSFGLMAAMTEIPGVVVPGTDPTVWPRRRLDRDTTLAQLAELVAPAVPSPGTLTAHGLRR